MRFLNAFGMFVARICIAAIFFWSSFGKLFFFEKTSQYMAAKGFTVIPLFLFGAALIEFLGALSLFFGFKTRWGALILLLFLIPTTLIFHDFWNYTGAEQELQMTMFLKNLAIFGGLLAVVCHGAGAISIDALRRRHKNVPPQPVVPPESKPL